MAERTKVWIQKFKGRSSLRLQWIDPLTGKRKTVSAKTNDMEEAEDKRSDKEYELNHGLHVEPSKMTWESFRETYERDKLSGNGEPNRRKAVVAFDAFERYAGSKTLGKIDERLLAGFTSHLRKRGLSASTIKSYLTYMRVSLRWAASQRLIREAPRFAMPKVSKGTNRERIVRASRMTTENFEMMLAKAPNQGWRILTAFAWHCGMRRGEARRVRGEDIDFERRLVRIPVNKAGDRAATAVIPPELEELLHAEFPGGLPDGPLVRGVPNQLDRITRGFVEKVSKPANVVGNSSDGYATLHDLRRNFGSRWAGKAPAQILQRLMRHSSITTTLDHYADTEAAAVALLWQKAPKAERNSPRNSGKTKKTQGAGTAKRK